jgi:large repetitive protein
LIVDRRCLVRFAGLFCLVTVVWAFVAVPFVYAFELENVTAWKWTGDTECWASAVGDVDGDGAIEIVSGGDYYDGVNWQAQLCVWDGSTLTVENVKTWYWTDYQTIVSIAIGDVDGDQSAEIVTGGNYFDGTRSVAQLCVWDGSTLALENVQAWHWTGSTYINSVAIADVDADGSVEIVTGGYYDTYAQLCVWSGSTLALEDVTAWYWVSDTYLFSVAVGDVDADGDLEIVTGGYYYDETHSVAQLCVWTGSTLALEQVTAWYWTSSTGIYSVAVGDIDGDQSAEIVTGGFYYYSGFSVAQLCVWSGSTLALENVETWQWVSDTFISSVAIADVDGDQSAEIVTGGNYWEGRSIAQLCVWSGSTLTLEDVTTWYWGNGTELPSIAVGDVDNDDSAEIITAGNYYDPAINAQLTVWTSTPVG